MSSAQGDQNQPAFPVAIRKKRAKQRPTPVGPPLRKARVGRPPKYTLIAGVSLLSRFLGVVQAWKSTDTSGRWVLATKRGIVIATFSTEEELEAWWKAFQSSQGRAPKQLGQIKPDVGRKTEGAALHLSQGSKRNRRPNPTARSKQALANGAGSDFLKPWSTQYDMPEYDLE